MSGGKKTMRWGGLSHLVELPIGAVLDELKGNVGSIGNSRKSQSTNIDGDTTLGTLTLVVRNRKLVTAVRSVKVVERVGVGDSGDLDSDCEKGGKF